MSKVDVDNIIEHFESNSHGLYRLENCSKSKAYNIKKAIDAKLNIHDKFCEVGYDKNTQTATFDIIS